MRSERIPLPGCTYGLAGAGVGGERNMEMSTSCSQDRQNPRPGPGLTFLGFQDDSPLTQTFLPAAVSNLLTKLFCLLPEGAHEKTRWEFSKTLGL